VGFDVLESVLLANAKAAPCEAAFAFAEGQVEVASAWDLVRGGVSRALLRQASVCQKRAAIQTKNRETDVNLILRI
jgi:hypothetical protein